jgi:NADH:ubiquinone oxidoreductase subunit 6 (subunit J)
MNLLAASPPGNAVGQLAAAAALGALAFYWLLPRPKGRSVAVGTFAAIAAAVVLVSWMLRQFGDPAKDTVGQILFWLFSAGAVGFAAVFVTQRNPARGAIAFAFVIVSVCGLFLLLAAPFLMAATIVIYAGAIIVTFLFVLMLSQTGTITDENDRSREPLLGSLAGFAFLGLVLFAMHQGSPAASADAGKTPLPLPARPVTAEERAELLAIAEQLRDAGKATTKDELHEKTKGLRDRYADVIGLPTAADAGDHAVASAIPDRLAILKDPASQTVRKQAEDLRVAVRQTLNAVENTTLKSNATPAEVAAAAKGLEDLREKTVFLAGRGELPARNVANIGYSLYTDYLLAVEMAGAILLVATIGAVAIAGRKGATA